MFKHMLVAVDGSALSDTAYCKAIELARPLRASITAMQVVPHYDVMRLQTAMLQETRERYMREAYRLAEEYLERIAKEAAAAGVTCNTACVTGDHILQVILDEAEARKCDLIVMSPHRNRPHALLRGRRLPAHFAYACTSSYETWTTGWWSSPSSIRSGAHPLA